MENRNAQSIKYDFIKKKYEFSRNVLLGMLIITLVNICVNTALLMSGYEVGLAFSAVIPCFTAAFAVISKRLVFYVVTVTFLMAYFCCWIFSKNHYGWMTLALGLFLVDTFSLFFTWAVFQGKAPGIGGVLLHIWILFYLIVGVQYGMQLKKISDSVFSESGEDTIAVEPFGGNGNSKKRLADLTAKARVFINFDMDGKNICFRRVRHVNELIVDGYVYDEIEMIMEPAHELVAIFDGHTIRAGYDGSSKSYLIIDDEEVAQKKRWW